MQTAFNGNGNDHDPAGLPLLQRDGRRASGTADSNMHTSNTTRNKAEDDHVDDDESSGWQLDDLQDETYELMPRSNGHAPLSDLTEETGLKGKTDTHSALAMVKAVVSEDDDPSLPTLTFRVIVLGTILCAIGAAVSQLFFVSLFELAWMRITESTSYSLSPSMPENSYKPKCRLRQ